MYNLINVWNKLMVGENNVRETSKKSIKIVNVGDNKYFNSYNVFVNLKSVKCVRHIWHVLFKMVRKSTQNRLANFLSIKFIIWLNDFLLFIRGLFMSKLFEFTKAKVKKKSRANFWKQRASLSKGATITKKNCNGV